MTRSEMAAKAEQFGTKAWEVSFRQVGGSETRTAQRFGQTAEAAARGVEWDIRGRAFPAEIVSVVQL